MLEKTIEKKLRDAVKKAGGIAYKFKSPGNAGVPDRIILMPGGKVCFIELKAEGGKPTDLQIMQMARIAKLGFDVRVLRGMAEVEEFIHEICTT